MLKEDKWVNYFGVKTHYFALSINCFVQKLLCLKIALSQNCLESCLKMIVLGSCLIQHWLILPYIALRLKEEFWVGGGGVQSHFRVKPNFC